MAVRNSTRKVGRRKIVEPMVVQPEMDSKQAPRIEGMKKYKRWVWAAIVVGAVVAWWWKTNTWPIVAFVGGRPVTRYEVNKALWAQSGQTIADSMITQKLVAMELDRLGVEADQDKVNQQIESMKASIPEGSNWEDELARSGFSEKQIVDQVALFNRINKAVEKDATVSAQEVDEYVKTNGTFLTGTTDEEKQLQAENMLKDDKIGAAIEAWIAKVRADGASKVFRIGVNPLPAQ